MTAAEIITKFELYMDDTTELSSTEELALLNKIYQRVSAIYPWESLKTAYSGTTDGTANLALPARFSQLTENDQYSENGQYGAGPVIYVGTDYAPYKVVSWSDRRNYRDQSNVAFLDVANDNLVFAQAPGSGKAVEFDYIETPADLTLSDTPWLPTRFQDVIYHGMCIDDFVIQQSEKALSYRNEHLANFNMYLSDMKSWNFKLLQMS